MLEPAPRATHQRRKQARPQELLAAALQLFAEKGFKATRSEEVAARAGVSKGTLYLYYPSKEELFKAVVRTRLSALIEQGRQRAEDFDGSTAELLRALMHGWWQRIGRTEAGGISKIMIAEARNFPELAQFYVDEVVQPAQRLIADCLRRGMKRGEFRAIDIVVTTQVLIAPLLFLSLHTHAIAPVTTRGVQMDPTELIDAHMELILHGLETRPTALSA